jgi:hypothetical protein
MDGSNSLLLTNLVLPLHKGTDMLRDVIRPTQPQPASLPTLPSILILRRWDGRAILSHHQISLFSSSLSFKVFSKHV